jgi:mannose-6-phosphate isomerase-like protein (cupin superfamily)
MTGPSRTRQRASILLALRSLSAPCRSVPAHRRRQWIVGRVEDYAKERGWFFGRFIDEPRLQSPLVEIAWQRVPNLVASPAQRHLHRDSVEVNIVIAGAVTVTINDTIQHIAAGGFFVIWPDTVTEDLTTTVDTEVIVVRAPGHRYDKVHVLRP